MRIFLITFVIALAAQLLLLFLFERSTLSAVDLILSIYLLPYMFLPVSDPICDGSNNICFYGLLSLPAVFYSICIASLAFGINRRIRRR